MEIDTSIPEMLEPLFSPKRYKILHGGRGGGKSVSVAKALLIQGVQRRMRILCTREVQKSLSDSVIKLLADLIEELGLKEFYEVQKSVIKGRNGTEFLFAGLQDHTVDSLRSYVNIDVAWVEEAHSVSDRSWNVLIPTIRREGSEIIATFNPDQETDYVYRRFVKGNDPEAWVCQINWRDNPWFPKVLDTERRTLQAFNDDLYQHVWEGKCRTAAGLLFKRRWFKRYKLGQHPKQLRTYMSTDYAGAPDADHPEREPDWNEFGIGGMDSGGDLWLTDWYSAQEDAADWLPAWVELVKKHKPLAVFEEKTPQLRMVDGLIDRTMRDCRAWVYRLQLANTSSKADRALGFAAYASTHSVYIPECEWGDRLINQLCAFTGQDGKADDMVDVCSLFGRGVDEMHDALPEITPEQRGVKPFTSAWLNSGDRPATPAKRL